KIEAMAVSRSPESPSNTVPGTQFITELSEPTAQPPTMTPEQTCVAMRDGIRRFMIEDVAHPNQDVNRRHVLTAGQRPHAVVLACSDSLVPVEIVFDQGLGDVFVIRTAGEITDLSVLASLEFAVDGLGVPLVLVLGHEACGA